VIAFLEDLETSRANCAATRAHRSLSAPPRRALQAHQIARRGVPRGRRDPRHARCRRPRHSGRSTRPRTAPRDVQHRCSRAGAPRPETL
jgi:hypothetical protein